MVVAHRRQLLEVYKTKVLVQAALAPHMEEGGSKALQESMNKYLEAALPYLQDKTKEEREESKAQLERWVRAGPMKIVPMMPTMSRGERALSAALTEKRAIKSALAERQRALEERRGAS